MSSNRPLEYAITLAGTELVSARMGVVFGFDAQQVLITNDSTGSHYISLASTAGTTGSFCVNASECLSLGGIQTHGMGVASTMTSTSQQVRVGAWAW